MQSFNESPDDGSKPAEKPLIPEGKPLIPDLGKAEEERLNQLYKQLTADSEASAQDDMQELAELSDPRNSADDRLSLFVAKLKAELGMSDFDFAQPTFTDENEESF